MNINTNRLRFAATMMLTTSAMAAPVHFQTNDPDGRMAMASHPPNAYLAENESADDFVLNATTRISHAQFTGLLANGATLGSVSQVVVEIYRVFPLDSVEPPSGGVPTRANSPSDNVYTFRDSASQPAGLHFLMSVGNAGTPFTAVNSVRDTLTPNAGGDGQITGTEVAFDVVFDQPLVLPPGHYFFVPQVAVDTGDDFYWLSAPRPITAPGTPIALDLQAWTRDTVLSPDWLRVGSDVVGGTTPPTFNAAFALDGEDDSVHFENSGPDGRMAMATRPPSAATIENEAADDFTLASQSQIKRATFTGLIPANSSLSDVTQAVVEIYRVFPLDSANPDPVVGHQVPTRANSPSDNAFDSRDSGVGDAQFTVAYVNLPDPAFGAANSVLDGIHPKPGQTTGGEGAIDGKEVIVSMSFDPPIVLPAGHYFFVPQVALTSGNFFWLSAATPGAGDLQSWIRNTLLSPDWLRVGTDIVGGATAPKFNGTFSFDGIREQIFQDNFEPVIP